MCEKSELVSQLRLTKDYISTWLAETRPGTIELQLMKDKLENKEFRRLVSNGFYPHEYFIENRELLECIHYIKPNTVKALSEQVYKAHLRQLIECDRHSDLRRKVDSDYGSYDAEMFVVFRYAKTKADINIASKMYGRKIRHHTYIPAKQKLRMLARKLEPNFISIKNEVILDATRKQEKAA